MALISGLPYYANFVFMSTNSDACFSTADIDLIKNHLKYSDNENEVYSLQIGNTIYFDPNDTLDYRITDIQIQDIVADTEITKYGFDSENCTAIQGENKEHLFKVLIYMELISTDENSRV